MGIDSECGSEETVKSLISISVARARSGRSLIQSLSSVLLAFYFWEDRICLFVY